MIKLQLLDYKGGREMSYFDNSISVVCIDHCNSFTPIRKSAGMSGSIAGELKLCLVRKGIDDKLAVTHKFLH